MNPPTLSPKDPEERILVTFDFSHGILAGETISGIPSISVEASGWPDASATGILDGSPIVSGSQVTQTIVGGIDGSTYKLRCLIHLTPSGRRLMLSGLLPVARA